MCSLLSATRAIADEIVQSHGIGPGCAPPGCFKHALIIDGRGLTSHRMTVLSSSRAARLLNKDPRDFSATSARQ